jgi:deoxycytidine triphosphate deaminase
MTPDLKPIGTQGDFGVPNLVTGDKLREAVRNSTFIEGGDLQGVEGVKYDFRMGSRILKASFTQAIDIGNLTETERSQIGVEPGEVVFVMTAEKLKLPPNMIATLSPKRTLAHSGIIVLGGFGIDPNYAGVLYMGLYNFSSTKYPLRIGRKLIAAMFYELNDEEAQDFPSPPPIADDGEFPGELVNLIKNYRPTDLKGLQDEIEDTKRQLVALRNDMTSDHNWKEDFKKSLDEHNRQLGLLIDGLKDEKEVRRQEDTQIRTKLEGLTNYITLVRAGWVVVGLVVAAVLGYMVPKLLGH